MKEIVICLAVIIGTVIGAGFASGKEIITFFNVYGNKGFWGIIIASLIFGLVVILVLKVIKNRNILEYRELINNNKFVLFVLQVFSFVCFCIMISGVGAFCEQQLNIDFLYGTLFASALSYAMFLNKFKGIEIFSCVLVPIIIVGILVLSFSNYDEIELNEKVQEIEITIKDDGDFWISAILYSSYNSLILVPILINFKKYNLRNGQIYLIGGITAFILGILILLIYKINDLFYPEIVSVELPNMMLASLLSPKIEIMYGVVILTAIFTTAFSCGFNFLEMRDKRNYERNALFICITSLLFSKIGFSNLINISVPVFGVFGIFQILLIVVIGCKGVKDEKK